MKLQNFISISEEAWINTFSEELEERGAAKKLLLFKLLVDGDHEDGIAEKLYSNIQSERRRKTLNQALSELYSEYLHFLLLRFRNYPEKLLFELQQALMDGNETDFNSRSETVERVLIDTDNQEALVGFYHLLRDHSYYKISKPTLYKEYQTKLTEAIDHVREFHALESYFIANDVQRRSKKSAGSDEEFEAHSNFFKGHFGKERSYRTQLISRLFWLRNFFSYKFSSLASEEPKRIAKEMATLMEKRPHLYLHFPEFIQYSNISYLVYTDHENISERQFTDLFVDYHETFDAQWVLSLYPRMYQALLSTQMKYLTEKAGYRFIDDHSPLNPSVEKGLRDIISLLKRVRDKASYGDQEGKKYGLVTEALCLQHLGGTNLKRAIELYEIMLVQEQQNQNAFGKHIVYINLIYCCFLSREWGKTLEITEKYARFTKVNNSFNETIEKVIQFIEMMSRFMLDEVKISSSELHKWSVSHFQNDLGNYRIWAMYSTEHLQVKS
jgi:hypothetical protein